MKRTEAIEFYKAERIRFEKSRDIQWKFDIALWTLIGLGITFFDREKVGQFQVFFGFLSFAFLFGHILFIHLVQRGLSAARTRADLILTILNSTDAEDVNIPINID